MAGRWSLAVVTLLVLGVGKAGVARASWDCPPECVKCIAAGGGWSGSHCYLPLKPDISTIEVEEIEDPVLIV